MNQFLYVLLLCFPISLLIPCEPFKGRILKPKNESSKDESFVKFSNNLTNAIKQKDVKFLQEITDPEIHFSFGGESGKKQFFKAFALNQNPKKSNIWEIFESTIKLGFYQNKEGHFVAPYLFETFPEDLDPFMFYVVNGTNVNIREDAHMNAKVIKKLSYDIVGSDSSSPVTNDLDKKLNKGDCNWQKVCLFDGTSGFICDKYLRSPLDYRIFFEKKKQKWMMTIFIAGD
ncbi:MAG: SH3 domain-containing protein [Leptospira sp.]|nr:SH3 domain-containing protein [Leptospira sp.]